MIAVFLGNSIIVTHFGHSFFLHIYFPCNRTVRVATRFITKPLYGFIFTCATETNKCGLCCIVCKFALHRHIHYTIFVHMICKVQLAFGNVTYKLHIKSIITNLCLASSPVFVVFNTHFVFIKCIFTKHCGVYFIGEHFVSVFLYACYLTFKVYGYFCDTCFKYCLIARNCRLYFRILSSFVCKNMLACTFAV